MDSLTRLPGAHHAARRSRLFTLPCVVFDTAIYLNAPLPIGHAHTLTQAPCAVTGSPLALQTDSASTTKKKRTGERPRCDSRSGA